MIKFIETNFMIGTTLISAAVILMIYLIYLLRVLSKNANLIDSHCSLLDSHCKLMQDVEELSAKYEELNTKYNAVIAELANLKKKKKERLFN